MSKYTLSIASLLAFNMLALPVTAAAQIVPQPPQQEVRPQPVRPPVTLREWSRLNRRERQISIVAAVEGLMLAISSPENPPSLNPQCLLTDTPETIEQKMSGLVRQFGNEPFVDVFLAAANCLPAVNGAAR